MTITTHTAIGAAIGFSLSHPVLGFAVGMLSHFAVDMIPHGDLKFSEQFKNKKRKAARSRGKEQKRRSVNSSIRKNINSNPKNRDNKK